jgi:outer membrane translocation and assembly module TamA
LLFLVLSLLAACAERPMKAPGESDITVSEVTLEAQGGGELTPDYAPLMDRLGMRASSLVLPGRYFSDFRVNEDRRRITAFWQNFGFFDVEVLAPKLDFDREENSVAIHWTIKENERYTIADVQLLHAPKEWGDALRDMIPFAKGATEIDLEKFRYVRRDMADELQRDGYGHAQVYTRAFVDTARKVIHWFYYVDAGPKTKVGSIVVEGNVKTDADDVIERSGLVVGEPFDWNMRYDGEFHLLDTGAYASTFIRANTDTKFHVPGDAPDTGGEIKDTQVDDDGNLIPRELPEAVDVKLHVVEAPSQQLRVRGGLELDPTRIDTALGATLWLRNVFGSWHHLVLDGRVGYGWLYRGTTDDPTGLYGEALVRYIKPMFLARLLDFRLSGRFLDELYPGFHLREVTAGPGLRVALAPGRAKNFHGGGFFFDTDVLFRFAQQVDFGPFDQATKDAFSLAEQDDYLGGELQASVLLDQRDNPFEAMKGYFLGLRAAFSPGGVERWNRYLTVSPEARGFIPLTPSLSVGARAGAGWAFLAGDDGIPLGPRLFGGGSYGMRGFGRHYLSPFAPSCATTGAGAPLVCQGTPVGGLSLMEGSLEGRFLPPLKPYGAVVFADVGGAGADLNPFEDGVSLALGLGLRLRFWYLPAAVDVSYRVLRENEVQVPEDEPFLVFFRLGEAF